MNALPKFVVIVPLLALGCASTQPSQELLDARRNYEQAQATPQTGYAPDRLLEAKQALDRAEQAHAEDARSFKEKSLAYIASRRAQLAVLYGKYAEDLKTRADADQSYHARQDELRQRAEAQAEQDRRKLEATRQQLGTLRDQLAGTRHELEQERTKVDEQPRGVVITLSGAVLFASGKSELLSTAKRKLDDVANALKEVGPNQQIVVEGYTDSQGADDSNQRLSEARAQAVRSYLVGRGVPADRISAVGKGEAAPVASNDTAEGRANNRRVEIVLPKQEAQPTSPASMSSPSGQMQRSPSGTPSQSDTQPSQSGTQPSRSSTPPSR